MLQSGELDNNQPFGILLKGFFFVNILQILIFRHYFNIEELIDLI